MTDTLYHSLAPFIPGIFISFWLFRIFQHRKNNYLFTFSLLALVLREFHVLFTLLYPTNRFSEFIDKACLLLQAALVLGVVSIVRVRSIIKTDVAVYYTLNDDFDTVLRFINGERKQATIYLIWCFVFFTITVLSLTKLHAYATIAWDIFMPVSYFMAFSALNNLGRANVDSEVSDRIDAILILYGVLGLGTFLIAASNHSNAEIILMMRFITYLFEAFACHFYAGLIQNYEVAFEGFAEAKEEKKHNEVKNIELGELGGSQTEIQINECEYEGGMETIQPMSEA